MSIKKKLILIIVTVIIAISAFAGVFFTWQTNILFTDQIKKNTEDKIEYSQQLIDFFFGRVEDNVNNLVKDPLIIEALVTKDPQKIQQISDKMTNMVDTISTIETMALMEVNGSTCTNVTASKASLSIAGKDFSERDYCRGIVKTKEPYLSSVYIGAVTKHPNLAMVIPVKNNNGEMIGFVSGVIDLSELRGYLWDLQKEGSYTVVLDRYNKPFIDTRVKIDKIADSSEEETLVSQNKIDQGFLTKGNYFISFRRFNTDTIIYAEPISIMQNALNSINISVVTYVSLITVISVIFLSIIISKIINRLNAVTSVAKKIAEGNMEVKIDEKDTRGKDEIGVLANAFNLMLSKLHDLYSGLEKKVEERTKELDEKNKKLEVSEGEIKKALDVSEQANKLMVGRELEMVKLKQRIKELEGMKT